MNSSHIICTLYRATYMLPRQLLPITDLFYYFVLSCLITCKIAFKNPRVRNSHPWNINIFNKGLIIKTVKFT